MIIIKHSFSNNKILLGNTRTFQLVEDVTELHKVREELRQREIALEEMVRIRYIDTNFYAYVTYIQFFLGLLASGKRSTVRGLGPRRNVSHGFIQINKIYYVEDGVFTHVFMYDFTFSSILLILHVHAHTCVTHTHHTDGI